MQEQKTSITLVAQTGVSCLFSCLVQAIPKQYRVIGEAIRTYRKKAGFTQERLSELADLHPNYLGEIERGETMVSLFALIRIAKALRVRLRDLVADI
ncbi:MAG TPA: helix-turn-helix transcriptional regulator [Verrucomicrobiae bacterium]|nr:helix-turn-helix transcriptional regulator [Verrucomicrobiae bacterium]